MQLIASSTRANTLVNQSITEAHAFSIRKRNGSVR